MNCGALFFFASFLALASSWVGLVLIPQFQVGRSGLVAASVGDVPVQYPPRRPGMAEQGAQVYRVNGCVSCHSQQVRQTGTVIDVVLTEAGTNSPAVVAALGTIGSRLDAAALTTLPKDALRDLAKPAADVAGKALKITGAKYSLRIRPIGPDISRGWGRRGMVAQDYLQDHPVFLGTQQLGPDLANIGTRKPDANWQLNHLYAPASVVPGSTMPAYRFLFEKRKIGHQPSPTALHLTGPFAPAAGFEIVPTADAQALVAYLKNLSSDASLFEAPMSAK